MNTAVNAWLRDHPWQADSLLAAALFVVTVPQLGAGQASVAARAAYVVVTVLLGGTGIGGGTQAGQAGVPGGGADLPQLIPHILRRPGGLDRVGVAQVQQPAIRHAAHVRSVDGAEGGEGLVPGGPCVGDGRDRFRADRVGGVVVAG